MKVDVAFIETVLGSPLSKTAAENCRQVLSSLEQYGAQFGLDKPHVAAQYLAQILHESGRFRYDKEVWGPTPAQERYDTRTDLGNTAAKDGDGFLFRGRTGGMLTGKSNYIAYRDWCRKNISKDAPDFEKDPDAVLKDPWEGLAPIWYWSTRNLNRYADTGDIEMITRRINGGINGLDDRMALYTRVALVMLGFGAAALREFQSKAKEVNFYTGDVDGLDGPKTRSALHQWLASASGSKVAVAPVVETVAEAVVPEAINKPLTHTSGFWERLTQIGGLSAITGLSAFFKDWQTVAVIAVALIVLSVVGLFLHKKIIDAVKDIKAAINS